MVEWISFFPKVCKHGVDQRYHFTSEKCEDGSVLSEMTRNICRQCLAEIDVRACLEYVRTHDIVKADE